jgi:hypothetical protein
MELRIRKLDLNVYDYDFLFHVPPLYPAQLSKIGERIKSAPLEQILRYGKQRSGRLNAVDGSELDRLRKEKEDESSRKTAAEIELADVRRELVNAKSRQTELSEKLGA